MSGAHGEPVKKAADTNIDALANQMPSGGSGEFHAKQAGDAPMTTHGHKPGVNVGNDAVPESNIKTMPAGSAPPESTFQPNPDTDAAPNVGGGASQVGANDQPGATSASVDGGLGKPMSGQTNNEKAPQKTG